MRQLGVKSLPKKLIHLVFPKLIPLTVDAGFTLCPNKICHEPLICVLRHDTLPFLLWLQISLKNWLGLDYYIQSIRPYTEGFKGMMARLFSSESGGGVIPGVKVSDITFAGIPVRVYEPPAGGEGHLRRGLMYFHGGGWALGSVSTYGLYHSFKLELRGYP